MARRVSQGSLGGAGRLAPPRARRTDRRPVRDGDRQALSSAQSTAIETSRGTSPGEVAAGVERVFVLRNQGRCDALPAFLARAAELDAAGYPEAAGPAAVAGRCCAELSGDDGQMVAVLDSIPSDQLSREWSAVVAFRLAIGNLTLGNSARCSRPPGRAARRWRAGLDRHVLALARWFAGDPTPALAALPKPSSPTRHAVTSAPSCSAPSPRWFWRAPAGADEAAAQLALTEHAAASSMSALLGGASSASVHCTRRRRVTTITLATCSKRRSTNAAVRAARLAPGGALASPWPTSCCRRSGSRSTAATSGRSTNDASPSPTPSSPHRERPAPMRDLAPMTAEAIATSVPLPWAMTLAARLAANGNSHGRQIAEGLFELYGEPAKESYPHRDDERSRATDRRGGAQAAGRDHDTRLGTRCDSTCSDRPSCGWRTPTRSATTANRERVRSLLLYLVLHGPVAREQIVEALWPHLDRGARRSESARHAHLPQPGSRTRPAER